jgi:hypothetical protein
MTFRKVSLAPPLCQGPKHCTETATHTIYDERDYRIGDYCEKHADAEIENNREYEAALERRFGTRRR